MISSKRVTELFLAAMYSEDEPKDGHVAVEGIIQNYGFHPERLEAARSEVAAMLEELPSEFHRSAGGGWSFLNLCNTKDGEQWTGMHQTMEQLCVLAIGLGLGHWLMPREMWSMFPGGMPYVVFDTAAIAKAA